MPTCSTDQLALGATTRASLEEDTDDEWNESSSLRVALLSTCALTTPPKGYGGTELVVAELARELAVLGHEPTVFATRDSSCVGARGCAFSAPVWPPEPLSELRHASAACRTIATEGFDVVHVNQPEALAFTSWMTVPTIATVHHERAASFATHYAAYPDVTFVAISHRQAELLWEVPIRAVIHHGLDVDAYTRGEGDGGYCAFLGRLAAAKGPDLAIDAARRAGVPIRLGGTAHEHERPYYVREVQPRLGHDAVALGELDHLRKVELLRAASALLFPIQWEEPFGLVMIEAMLVGTPVIAFRCGSAPELIEDGVTGWLVDTVDEMASRLADVKRIDRRRCRDRARVRFSARRMALDYSRLYRRVVESSRAHGRCVPLRRDGTATVWRRKPALTQHGR